MQVLRFIPLFLLGGLLACQKPDPVPSKPDTGTHAGDSVVVTPPGNATTTPPGNATTTPPGNTTTTVPGSSTATPPVDSIKATKKVKISWSTNDFQEIRYDATGQPVQYISQYVDNQGTGHVRRFVYTLQYSPQQQLIRMGVVGEAGSSYATYQYNGGQVSQTSLYTADGRLLSACTYQYAGPNQLSQVDEVNAFSNTAERRTYQYDAAGNLRVLTTYARQAATGSYALQHTLSFSDYDTQHDVENLLFHLPLLPNVTFRTNNHGLKVLRDPSGRELSRERTTYQYNEQGYPVQQTRTGPGGVLTAWYSY